MNNFIKEFLDKNKRFNDFRWGKLNKDKSIYIDCVGRCGGISLYKVNFDTKTIDSKGHRHYGFDKRLSNNNIQKLIDMKIIDEENLIKTYLKFKDHRDLLDSLFGDILTPEQKKQIELEEEVLILKKQLENCKK